MSLHYNGDLIKTAKALRKNATPWEKELWFFFLKDYPVRFQRQKVIDNYIVDFYCAKVKLAVELDGSSHYTVKGKTEDGKRTQKLKQLGVKIIRFSNTDVSKSFYEVCSVIDCTVKALLSEKQITKAK